MTRNYSRPGDVFHELADMANTPRPPSPADILHEQQAAADAQRKADLDRAVAAQDAERKANRISGV